MFLILEVIDVIFGEHVELGGFLEVLALVITLMIARAIFKKIYDSLGSSPRPAAWSLIVTPVQLVPRRAELAEVFAMTDSFRTQCHE